MKRALISVYDKTGIVEFARALVEEFGIKIISTGGTARLLKENNLPVTLVEEITGAAEMLEGRVKTLHPKIFAAILADRDNPQHMKQLAEQGIEPIDMVVVNLYPFQKTVADRDCTLEQAIEMIDIGGPALLRAAGKNHKHVVLLSHPMAYDNYLKWLRTSDPLFGALSLPKSNARYAYQLTAEYDAHVATWFSTVARGEEEYRWLSMSRCELLRYGENPHQAAEHWRLCVPCDDSMFTAARLCDMRMNLPMSYNNYTDAAAALELCKELTRALNPEHAVPASPHVGPASPHVGPTFQSVTSRITEEHRTERHPPHIQNPGSHYFLTFRIKSGTLEPRERQIVLDACKYWHGKKLTLHACVVMPDHVHLLLTPHEVPHKEWVSLGEITRSIKAYSAREINKLRGRRGSIWLDESWDRIVRDEREYAQRWEYIENNPVKAGLGEAYPWLWLNRDAWLHLADYYDRLKSRSHTVESRSYFSLHTPSRTSEGPLQGPKGRIQNQMSRVCVFIKHTNACGVGIEADPSQAYQRAYCGDPRAAMGGALACSFDVDETFARTVMETYDRWGKEFGAGGFFVEVWVAPGFTDDAIKTIRAAKAWGERVRLLAVSDMLDPPDENAWEYRSIPRGMLAQSRDLIGLNEGEWKVVTKRKPAESQMADLRLAWLIAKHTRSNAVSICKDGMLIGNGAGQMSRVMSCRIATWLATENGHAQRLRGAAAASDGFFPFPDGPNVLLDAGVTAIIQPGGAKRDDEVIRACDQRNVAMIFTATRHFKH